ncbi:hypothetical protein [Actinoplanes sp. NPDC023714]|uniref:hypothetical protein n=1 Tax=Actinoplanes sp. NPDC023714 TaxID=3154322 RepID=UPI0034074CD8
MRRPAVAGVAFTIFVLIIVTTPDKWCSEETCDAEPLTSIGVSLLFAVPVMTYLHRWSAVVAAALAAVVWPIADRVDHVGMGWRMALPLALVAATVWAARRKSSAHLKDPAGQENSAHLTKSARLKRPAGALLLIAGLAGTAWTLHRQAEVTAQEAAARSVPAVVRVHQEDTVIGVDLADGDSYYMEVLAAGDYPVGSRVEVLVDDDGLRQLASEPYDITILLVPTVTAGGVGAALLARAAGRRGHRQGVRGDNGNCP